MLVKLKVQFGAADRFKVPYPTGNITSLVCIKYVISSLLMSCVCWHVVIIIFLSAKIKKTKKLAVGSLGVEHEYSIYSILLIFSFSVSF